jgi:hypothetical protein
MRCIKILFIIVSIVTGTCIGQENDRQDYPVTSIESLFANPTKYDGKNISIVGVLDLSHFEDANMHGIRIDWGCYDPSKRHTAELGWERWNAWIQLGINGRNAQIAGTFVFSEAGSYVPWEDTLMISKIEYIRIISGEDTETLNKNPHLMMNCNYLRRI